jgi:pentatricopeptide repeat protein
MDHFFRRRFDQAEEMLAMSMREVSFPGGYRALASCYAHMGRLDEARAIVERLRQITPNVIPSSLPWTAEYRELFLSGLRLAAGEVT